MSDSNNQDMKLLINYLINNSVNSNSYPKGTSSFQFYTTDGPGIFFQVLNSSNKFGEILLRNFLKKFFSFVTDKYLIYYLDFFRYLPTSSITWLRGRKAISLVFARSYSLIASSSSNLSINFSYSLMGKMTASFRPLSSHTYLTTVSIAYQKYIENNKIKSL